MRCSVLRSASAANGKSRFVIFSLLYGPALPIVAWFASAIRDQSLKYEYSSLLANRKIRRNKDIGQSMLNVYAQMPFRMSGDIKFLIWDILPRKRILIHAIFYRYHIIKRLLKWECQKLINYASRLKVVFLESISSKIKMLWLHVSLSNKALNKIKIISRIIKLKLLNEMY